MRFPAYIALLLLAAALAALQTACLDSRLAKQAPAETQAAPKEVFTLGKVWKVEEGYYDEPHWIGVWTRRGNSNVFDATWRHCWMNETKQDVIEVESVDNGKLVLFRQGIKQRYRGTFSTDQPGRLRGTADWFGPDMIWTASIE